MNTSPEQSSVTFPEGLDGYGRLLHIGNIATNWLTCATYEEYPRELRALWRERARQWLDANYNEGVPFFSPKRSFMPYGDPMFMVHEVFDTVEALWDETEHLGFDPTAQPDTFSNGAAA